MSVLFIVDSFGIYEEEALRVTHPKQVASIRARIHQHLLKSSATSFRIHVSQALFRRFKSFEGMQGVQVRYLYPASQLANRLGERPQTWLTNDLIMSLHLLKCPPLPDNLREIENSAGKVLGLLHPVLLQPENLSAFYEVLRELPPAFATLLRLETIQARLIQSLQKLIEPDCIQLLIQTLSKTNSLATTLDALACEQIRETLRSVVQEHPTILEFPLAARQFDKQLLTSLPTIEIAEPNAQDVPTQLIQLLEILNRQVIANSCSEHVLAKLIVVAWPTVLARLTELLAENPKLASQALADALYALADTQATVLAKQVEENAHLAPCEALSETATVEEALLWSWQYLDCARREFLRQQEPSELISSSFSHWLTTQQARIMRSDADWRRVSAVTAQHLAANRLVVLCMIDALGALNTDLVCAKLKQCENVCIDEQLLFSPIPTLTEVAKMAVITGKNVAELPSNTETALRQHYANYLDTPNALKIAKSWVELKDSLDTDTKLLVYFENRIDERLHACTSFKKHRQDIKTIAKQLVNQIKDWMIDAAQLHRELVVLITADHGVTSIAQRQAIATDLGEIGERTVKVKQKPYEIPDKFAFFPQVKDASSGYLVPKERVRTGGNTPLTHGGLSPEEVLIPFITVTKGVPLSTEKIIELKVENSYCPIVNGRWQANLMLITHAVPLTKIKITAKSPFTGEEGPIGPLRVYETKPLRLSFTSAIEQSGQVQVPVFIRYCRADTQTAENLDIELTLHFYR
ncbi:MAG: hypothetical protein DRR19_12990 [Candidatus Parabeggiatoa sp. nov. 1]|nr:MAG: hypothetical protein DRR19_12990 [Gammaproteobacteria bacterium]